ncbi:MAG: AAA family ATPase [Prolixibacteraceae bacterium]|jgi:predicted ATP-binding protein involved in virulence|nr:AAA family ATPase [Prolixibacteraceae bacterium]
MLIEKVKIKNFRKFKELDLEFERGVNILIGDNGSGKTSILEALKVVLGGFFYGVNSKYAISPSIHKTNDVQYIQDENGQFFRNYPTSIYAKGIVLNQNVQWDRDLNSSKSRTTIGGLSDLKEIVQRGIQGSLPIVAYYSINRFEWNHIDNEPYKKDERYEAYLNALDAKTSVNRFVKWYENEDRISYREKKDTYALKIVNDAIQKCLPNCLRVFYDAKLGEIVILNKDNEQALFSFMSDGYRLITSLVGDLAYRCAVLNPHLGLDCLKQTKGVVLIDEIETHLHPSWQQRVVRDLSNVFPEIQFVISTHSPVVLSGYKANVIDLVEGEQRNDEKIFTYGRRPEYIMSLEQGVVPRLPEIQDQIDRFYELIERKEGLKEAKEILENLFIAQFGENDPDTKRAMSDYEFALMEFDVEE